MHYSFNSYWPCLYNHITESGWGNLHSTSESSLVASYAKLAALLMTLHLLYLKRWYHNIHWHFSYHLHVWVAFQSSCFISQNSSHLNKRDPGIPWISLCENRLDPYYFVDRMATVILLGVLLHIIAFGVSTPPEIYYVRTTNSSSSDCPHQPSLTLHQYTQTNNFTTGTALQFLPGNHMHVMPIVYCMGLRGSVPTVNGHW